MNQFTTEDTEGAEILFSLMKRGGTQIKKTVVLYFIVISLCENLRSSAFQ